jgi:hypothetical protein
MPITLQLEALELCQELPKSGHLSRKSNRKRVRVSRVDHVLVYDALVAKSSV